VKKEDIYNIIEYEIDDIKDHRRVIKYIDSLEQRNAELEQRVKELEEPKTCDGCEHYLANSEYWGECNKWNITVQPEMKCPYYIPIATE